jgi:hypothetical protein
MSAARERLFKEEKFMEFILGFAIWVGDGGWKIGGYETQ